MERSWRTTVYFDAKFDRLGVITLDEAVCHHCHMNAICICIDSSGGEYGEGRICMSCIEALYEGR